jgi:hypothetical protein
MILIEFGKKYNELELINREKEKNLLIYRLR